MRIQMMIGMITATAQCSAAVETTTPPRFYDVGFRADIEYLGPGREERLDLYFPKDPARVERFPGVVIIHGGGWSGGDKGDAREINIGANLARAGYVCASINYVLTRTATPSWPENLYDCKRAVQYLRVHADELHLDANHIGCIGGSAGGHLSAMLGVCGPDADLEPPTPYSGVSSSVQAAVDMYGIADLLNWQYTEPDGTPTGRLREAGQAQMLGAARDQNPTLWKTASPIVQADPDDCPILILHGTADATVDYLQSVNFAKRLEEIGLEHECYIIEGAHHTFDLHPQGKKHVDVRRIVLNFYDRHLRGMNRSTADARYRAMLAYEKANPARTRAGRWTGAAGTVKEVTQDRTAFAMTVGETLTRIAIDPAAVFAVQRPGTVDELENGTLVSLHGARTGDDGVFEVTSVLRYAPGYNAWQYARDTRIVGRWYRENHALQVSIQGKKRPITLAGNVDVAIRTVGKPDVLKPGARIVVVTGKRLGFDLFASRIVVRSEDR